MSVGCGVHGCVCVWVCVRACLDGRGEEAVLGLGERGPRVLLHVRARRAHKRLERRLPTHTHAHTHVRILPRARTPSPPTVRIPSLSARIFRSRFALTRAAFPSLALSARPAQRSPGRVCERFPSHTLSHTLPLPFPLDHGTRSRHQNATDERGRRGARLGDTLHSARLGDTHTQRSPGWS